MPLIGRTNPHASVLRRNATDCERMIWQALRNRQLEGCKFRRQATIGPYVVDFLCAEFRMIIEIDGGQHDEASDRQRTAWLHQAGYDVHRFWNHEVIGNLDGVLEAIRQLAVAAREARATPSPNPLPQAGEG